MQDLETESLWSHVTGEALHGPLKGRQLQAIPSFQTTWEEWVQQHPETKVLKKDRVFTKSRYEEYFKDPDRIGLFRTQWIAEKMPGKTLVHGLTRGPHALAVPEPALRGLVDASLGDERVILWRSTDGGVRAFLNLVNGEPLNLVPISSQEGKDRATGSTWDLGNGQCLSGPLLGRTLEAIPVTTAYWFAWSSFYPNTRVAD